MQWTSIRDKRSMDCKYATSALPTLPRRPSSTPLYVPFPTSSISPSIHLPLSQTPAPAQADPLSQSSNLPSVARRIRTLVLRATRGKDQALRGLGGEVVWSFAAG